MLLSLKRRTFVILEDDGIQYAFRIAKEEIPLYNNLKRVNLKNCRLDISELEDLGIYLKEGEV